jgi:hypothetical protein
MRFLKLFLLVPALLFAIPAMSATPCATRYFSCDAGTYGSGYCRDAGGHVTMSTCKSCPNGGTSDYPPLDPADSQNMSGYNTSVNDCYRPCSVATLIPCGRLQQSGTIYGNGTTCTNLHSPTITCDNGYTYQNGQCGKQCSTSNCPTRGVQDTVGTYDECETFSGFQAC